MNPFRPALLLLAPLAACTFELAPRSAWVADSGWVEQTTAERTVPIEAAADTPLKVQLDVRSEHGAASWTITDPEGVVRFRCQTEAAQHLQQTCLLPALAGTWTVRREWQEFTGQQQFTVTARTPDTVRVTLSAR